MLSVNKYLSTFNKTYYGTKDLLDIEFQKINSNE